MSEYLFKRKRFGEGNLLKKSICEFELLDLDFFFLRIKRTFENTVLNIEPQHGSIM